MRPRNLKFVWYINPCGYSMQTKFHVPRSHSFREKCDDNLKLASHFSPILCDRGTLNSFLDIKPYGYSMQTKFDIPRSHSFREKCDENLKLASHFSPLLYDRGTWNFFCILTHMDTLCKPYFMFLAHTVFEKNVIITWNQYRTFLRYCATEELEIFFVY